MIEWLKTLSKEDRQREVETAMNNLSRCYSLTGNDYFKKQMILLANTNF